VDYAINQLPSQEIDIPIKILVKSTGFYTVKTENVLGFANSSCLILEDLFSGTNYNLSATDSFNVFVSDTTSIAQFLLHIGAPKITTVTPLSCHGTTDGAITFSKNSTSPFNLLWKDSIGNIISNSNNVLITDSIVNLPSGTYYIESTDMTCGNTIDTVKIDNLPAITALFSVASDTINLSNGGNISFSNQSNNASNYLWDFGDGNFSNNNSPTHTYNQNGNYLITLTASQNSLCSESYTSVVTVIDQITGIDNDLTRTENVKTWISDQTLNVNLANSNYSQLEVRNLIGQLVYSKNQLTEKQYTIDLSNFTSSMYVVALSNNTQTDVIKVPYIK